MRIPLALLLLAAVAAPARADQFMYLDLEQARAALDRIRAGDVVHHFCAPCGEARSERMTVRSLGIERVWDRRGSAEPYRSDGRTFWMVKLNDVGVDLAYMYVREHGRWRNLAQHVGLQPRDVPSVLPAARIGTHWLCGTLPESNPGNPYRTGLDDGPDPCPVGHRDAAHGGLEWR